MLDVSTPRATSEPLGIFFEGRGLGLGSFRRDRFNRLGTSGSRLTTALVVLVVEETMLSG